MSTLVIGASGATGKLLVEQLLKSGKKVKIIIRSTSKIPNDWESNEKLTVIRKNITEITLDEMAEFIANCQYVTSCLGHNLTWKGIYGKPRSLVTDTVKLLCQASIKNGNEQPIKFILMNTAGNRNRDLDEAVSNGQKIVIGLIRLLLPPHLDNEQAAEFLRVKIGQANDYIEWVVVRPDTLVNNEIVSNYSISISPTRSAIFNPGKTSRINVANFIAKLIMEQEL